MPDFLATLIAEYGSDLPPQIQRALIALETHQDALPLLSMREMARRCGLPASSFSRLARAVGFDDFAGLRAACLTGQRAPAGGFAAKAGETPAQPLPALRRDILGNVEAALSPETAAALAEAAGLLAAARRVVVTGARSCYGLAHAFAYAGRLFSDKIASDDGLGGTFGDSLRFVAEGDAVVALSFDPYSRQTLETVTAAAGQGAAIIAITDNRLSPLAEQARAVLVTPVETTSFFHSLAAPMAVLDSLLLAWFQAEGGPALDALRWSDDSLRRHNIYARPKRRSLSSPAQGSPDA